MTGFEVERPVQPVAGFGIRPGDLSHFRCMNVTGELGIIIPDRVVFEAGHRVTSMIVSMVVRVSVANKWENMLHEE